MTAEHLQAIAAASRVLRYPGDGYAADLRSFAALCRTLGSPAASSLEALANRASSTTTGSMQELFTQSFDLTPACALEVGWHLYGEDYVRGAFLVRMREQLRAHAIDEGGELPDHLASLLALVVAAPDDTRALVRDALLPSVDKMLSGLEKTASPFHPIMDALRGMLAAAEADVAGRSSHV
jgi:nitrate reductase delta subunit